MKVYKVGGAVRDQLLGKNPSDIDYVVTGATSEEMEKLGYTQVGLDFPVYLHPITKDEYALARIERKTGSKHTDFETFFDPSVKLEEDLSRRDLTINAMAELVSDENGLVSREKVVMIDPFNGKKDLENRVLRHVSPAFREDPLRVLRLARFTAKYVDFTIAEETMDMVKKMVLNGELKHLSADRVWEETKKAFLCEKPSNYIDALDKFGALSYVFPDILKMKDVPQRADYHAEGDVFIHNQMVLDQACLLSKDLKENDKLLVRFGALFHDIGKAYTPYDLLYGKDEDGKVIVKGNHFGHDQKEVVEEKIKEAAKFIRIPNDFRDFAIDVAYVHQLVHDIKNLSPSKVVKMFNDLGLKNSLNKNMRYIDNLMLACHADSLGRLLTKDNQIVLPPQDYPQKKVFLKYANEYLNTHEELQKWMVKYKERNDKQPSGDLIRSQMTQIRVNKVKKSKNDI
jgi:tRNA nucleotidyltransferase (CCA-adding enzyme)